MRAFQVLFVMQEGASCEGFSVIELRAACACRIMSVLVTHVKVWMVGCCKMWVA